MASSELMNFETGSVALQNHSQKQIESAICFA